MSQTRVKDWICTTVDVRGGMVGSVVAGLEAVGDRGKLWAPDTVLRVGFLQGEPALQARVLQAARSWLQPGVRLRLEPADSLQDAQLRISFEPGGGSWSMVGTDALLRPAGQATMNLGWATLDTAEDAFSSVVVHEFGHALGLLHEHNHPEARIQWNKPAVNAELGGPPNHWTQATIDFNVYQAFEDSTVITTDFDAASVMIYTVPERWTLDGRSFMPSNRLSEGDKAAIVLLYGPDAKGPG